MEDTDGVSLHGYTFSYDKLSRLTQADYHLNNNRSNNYDTRYTYDRMGNILTLKRRGLFEPASSVSSVSSVSGIYDLIDDLTFEYEGNQIYKATDAVDDGPYYKNAWHYRDNANHPIERTYDANGNLTKDLDAKISSIQYNFLNLPLMITFNDGSTTEYTYDAAGRKLRTEHKVKLTAVFDPGVGGGNTAADTVGTDIPVPFEPIIGGQGINPQSLSMGGLLPEDDNNAGDLAEHTVTDYCGNIVYENGKLSRILFDGGFITFPDTTVQDASNPGKNRTVANTNRPQYHYFFCDRLGSVRVVTDAQGNIEQINHYYPYGGLMGESKDFTLNQPYKYNGKELDCKNGLDCGARFYDGII